MIEILVVLLLLVSAAKKPARRRKFRRYIRGNVNQALDLGTLAANTLVLGAANDTVKERTWISSIVAQWSLQNYTRVDDVGPMLFGVAHGDYTAAEIEAWIEQGQSWDEGDLVSREISSRKIKQIGTLGETQVDTAQTDLFQDGKAIKTKIGWIINAGQTIDFWVYNSGSAAIATTVPNLRVQGHVNLFPT